jgi:hypothetical protein
MTQATPMKVLVIGGGGRACDARFDVAHLRSGNATIKVSPPVTHAATFPPSTSLKSWPGLLPAGQW